MFIREQRLYNTRDLRHHIEYGDRGDEKHGEILPHPYCDFCEKFEFNDLTFFNHLSRTHLTCHLCPDENKNIYYREYPNLEIHFTQTHFICPYEVCKAKCYVAFKTEVELKTHIDIEHNLAAQASKGGKVKANALLAFEYKENENEEEKKEKPQRQRKVVIKDKEGIDFSYYFSQKYANILEWSRKPDKKHRGEDDRFRGRGQRGRGGRGRGGNQRKDGREEEKKEGQKMMRDLIVPEEKLAAFLHHLSDFIHGKLDKKELKGEYIYPRN